MIINVIDVDIIHGRKQHCHLCPVARALTRATNLQWTVTHFFLEPNLGPHGGMEFIATPDEVSEFMAKFDGGESVVPFSFEIDFNNPYEFILQRDLTRE